MVRTRISVVADPEMYRVVEYCRKLCGGSIWPKELKKPLERLTTDVREALVLLGRQGQRDQALLGQLAVLCDYPERARALAREIVAKHPELPEDVRNWLEAGRTRVVQQPSQAAIDLVAGNSDESIGLALQAARQARLLRDSLHEPLAASLDIYDPTLATAARELLDRVQVLAVQVEQAASLRGLDLYGIPGEEVELSTKFFATVGTTSRQRMTVRQPAGSQARRRNARRGRDQGPCRLKDTSARRNNSSSGSSNGQQDRRDIAYQSAGARATRANHRSCVFPRKPSAAARRQRAGW